MRKIRLCLLLLTALFATGCPNEPSKDLTDDFVNKLNNALASEEVRFDCAKRGFQYSANYSTMPWTYTCQEDRPDKDGPAKAMVIRNDAIEKLIGIMDRNYLRYTAAIERRRSVTNFVADTVELGAGLAIGVMNGQRALKITGIALNTFRAGRESADLNFYKQQTTAVLISKMNDSRAKVYADILQSKQKSADDYGMEAAIKDVVDYYNAGSLITAFQNLREDTAAEAQQSKAEVRRLKKIPITGATTVDFRNLSVVASDILVGLYNDLKDAGKKDQATKTLQAIVGKLESDKDIAPILKNSSIASTTTEGSKLYEGLRDIRRSAALVNNDAVLNKVNQAIVDTKLLAAPPPTPTPSATPTPTPTPKPTP